METRTGNPVRFNNKIIGVIEDRPDGGQNYVKRVKPNHAFRGMYGITEEIFNGLPRSVDRIVLEDVDFDGVLTGRKRFATYDTWKEKGIVDEVGGYEPQIYLDQRFLTDENPPNENQIALFGAD